MEELETCPFCGKKMQITTSKCITADGSKTGYHGYCAECGMHTQTRFSEEEAIADVNRRAEPENKIFTVKQLKQMSGDPVWIKKLTCPELSHWIIVGGYDKNSIFSTAGGEYPITFYAKTWLPYARKPEGSETP